MNKAEVSTLTHTIRILKAMQNVEIVVWG